MKIVNRGYLIVSPLKPFYDWANEFESEMYFTEEDQVEPTIYLIDEDFMDTEQLIRENFKKIFLNELNSITENVDDHPAITEENFYEWFDVMEGTTVFDLLTSNLKKFDLNE